MMLTGSFAPRLARPLPGAPRTCLAKTGCQHTTHAVPLRHHFGQATAFKHACVKLKNGSAGRGRSGLAAAPQSMFKNLFKTDEAGKTRKKYQERVDKVNAQEPKYEAMDDATLKEQTHLLRQRLEGGESLESVLPDAFAVRRGPILQHGSAAIFAVPCHDPPDEGPAICDVSGAAMSHFSRCNACGGGSSDGGLVHVGPARGQEGSPFIVDVL